MLETLFTTEFFCSWLKRWNMLTTQWIAYMSSSSSVKWTCAFPLSRHRKWCVPAKEPNIAVCIYFIFNITLTTIRCRPEWMCVDVFLSRMSNTLWKHMLTYFKTLSTSWQPSHAFAITLDAYRHAMSAAPVAFHSMISIALNWPMVTSGSF